MRPSTFQAPAEKNYLRNAYIITSALMFAAIVSTVLLIYFGFRYDLFQLFIPAGALTTTLFLDIFILRIIGNNKKDQAMLLVMLTFLINIVILTLVLDGLGAIFVASVVLVFFAISGLTLSSRYLSPGLISSFLSGVLILALDGILKLERIDVPELQAVSPYIAGIFAFPIAFIFFREFNRFGLQTKITLGILLTGGFTVATLVYFGFDRANVIGNSLADKYEGSVRRNTENEISNATNLTAEKIDNLLLKIQDDLTDAVSFRIGLESDRFETETGSYWKAEEELIRLSGGQYGNSNSDLASVYIPNTYALTDALLADLNKTIYLDLLAPNFLAIHKEVAGVYYISKHGYTVYYPNIDLANNISPEFDPTQQVFYTIATPDNNPDRQTRWTPPYEDPAGAGLIITVSIPVYDGNSFEGVMSADIRLESIVKEVASTEISETGFPILVDNGGIIITMPDAGYNYFGLEPEVLEMNEAPTLTILNNPNKDLEALALQIVSTESGLSKFNIDGVETYLSVVPLQTTGFKFAYVAPASELEAEITASRIEVDNEVRETLQNATLILAILFAGAFIASLFVGQVITRPLKRLTETVEEIAGGNLSSRASVDTGDESGLLARSFNAMADRLAETLQGLEAKIAERTRELESISESNAYRASLFESIARISRIINTTQDLNKLLPQITETISQQLGYYHVGIFMIDPHREFAVLVAANSEGGKVMLARNHRLGVGETGIVGYVTQAGLPRVALDVGRDAVYFNNPDLPETHSEIALPLRSGGEVIGALDVQSKITNAFSEEDVNILSVLADQVSIAIQNARSFEQSREALDRAEQAAAQLSQLQWAQFTKQESAKAFHYDGVNVDPLKPGQKLQANNLAIPILLRGVQVGTIKLSTPDPYKKWDDNEIAITQATAERTALAIETARLLQEAQKRAAKERAIGDISAKIGSLINIENIVQTTIQELGETLPGTDIAIQFTSDQSGQKS